MIKVGIIGCGKHADQHAAVVDRIPDSRIVAACDSEEWMARQFCDRFDVPQAFADVSEFLEKGRPDVVHITTPPQSHFPLGKACLEAGCHVYIEKPFTVDTAEAKVLVDLAVERGLKLTAGHNSQFGPASLRMRKLVRDGYIGGAPTHMESYYFYDMGNPRYVKALLGDKKHWVRALPGRLLQNIISHCISKIAEYMSGTEAEVKAHGFTSKFLLDLGEDIIDELRVTVKDSEGVTAYFTFSSQSRPILHQFRLFGPKNALAIDDDHNTLIKYRGEKWKSFLDHFMAPAVFGRQYLGGSLRNIWAFMTRNLHNDKGAGALVEALYTSIREDGPEPIPYREILLTSQIMDEIFAQVDQGD